ncbi:PREDICTED: probable G-protein coupled receptor 116 [Elephantulus edwardii]|uniref:probable G-protein coupled receptor 116 n=1 Tax=Elephantulus edwardii TaxID=28737 RepID=UPI0003F0DDCF|nr:PREDICTED: probable G-protein coupled receptor 116 [Elephantulus edwardii]
MLTINLVPLNNESVFSPVLEAINKTSQDLTTSNSTAEEYTVDIEISFENASFLESIKDYLNKLSYPIVDNSTEQATDILSMVLTTECRPTGSEVWCSCAKGYEWPREKCLHNLTCQEYDSSLSGRHCNCLKQLPAGGPYCQLQRVVTLRMSVKLNVEFSEDLKNSSSALYRSYKTDLELAFSKAYSILSGFKAATVTGFRPGSVVVNYEVKATSPSPDLMHKANEEVIQNLNETYKADDSSFQTFVNNETKFSVTPPGVIFVGDTVILTCVNEIFSSNVTWYHVETQSDISNNSRFFVYSVLLNNTTSVSQLTIENASEEDSGQYICRLTLDIFAYEARTKISVVPFQISISQETTVVCDNNPVNLECCSEKNTNWSSIEWIQDGTHYVAGIPQTDLESGCTKYVVIVDETQCPAEKIINFTCEFVSAYGGRGTEQVKVNFFPKANLTIIPDQISVSEGQNFSLRCINDVSSYDEVYWNTSTGIKIYQRFYTTTRYPDRVESVLTVKTSTREWNGTYHCIFRVNNSYSIATGDVTVYPLPLESDIRIDPLEDVIPCKGSHSFKCCVEEKEDYKVTFQMDSFFFPAAKEVYDMQICYKYKHNFMEDSTFFCPRNIEMFCHFTNAANNSVRSPAMKLNLIPGNNITCQDPVIGVGEPGRVIRKLCQFSNVPSSPGSRIGGNITYKCEGSQWMVKRNDCISSEINSLLDLAKALIKSPSQDEKLPKYLQSLSISTGKVEKELSISPGNLGAIINILDLLSTVPTKVNKEMMTHILSTVSAILGGPTLSTWKILLQQQTNGSSRLLDSVERFSRMLQSADSTVLFISQENVQMRGIVIKMGHSDDYNQSFVFSEKDLWGSVVIDQSHLESLETESSVVTMAFPTLKTILTQDIQAKNSAGSLVMTTTMSYPLTTTFKISMSFKNNEPLGGVPRCVFWNFKLANHTGGWDSEGCYVKEVHGDIVSCTCDHLTSFSILMSPDSPDPGSLLKILLDIISYIGLGFSILSLAACLVVEAVVWKSVTKNRTSYMRHICIVNIAASLLVADTWFIVAAVIHDHHYPLSDMACVAATFFIHFFYLSVFFWMLTLGLMLFYRLVFILHDTSKSIQKGIAFSLGYGCPLVISVITVGVTQPQDVYTRKNACWLNWEDTKALLAFIIPALIIVVVNVTITVVVITKILRPSVGDKPNKQEKSSLFQITKSIGVLTPLLGLTWGFGLATVFQGSNVVFHIVFTLLNAFQGLFILLFGCLWDQKVQEALLNKFSLSRWSSQHSKSTSLGSATPVFSMSSPISRRFNNLFGKTGTYNVSTPETTSSSLENSSSAYSLLH